MSDVVHAIRVLEPAGGYGAQQQIECSGCGWKSDRFYTQSDATVDFRRHERLLVEGAVGLFECGCMPGDTHPLIGWTNNGGKHIRQSRQCPVHRKPYIPKSKPRKVKPPTMPADRILEALRRKHMDVAFDFQRPWYFTVELRLDTGFAGDSRRGGQRAIHRQLCNAKGEPKFDDFGRPVLKRVNPNATRLDAFAMHMWRSKDFQRIAYEVKVTREDFLNEIRKPWKREPGMAVSNLFFYVTPKGLLDPDEIPEGCGLMEVTESLQVKIRKRAPLRNVGEEHLPTGFVVSVIRRCMKEMESSVRE